MTVSTPRPPFDPELSAILAALGPLPVLDDDTFKARRAAGTPGRASIAEDVEKYHVQVSERVIAGPRGDVTLTVVSPSGGVSDAPAIYHIHGGGMIMGDRFSYVKEYGLVEWVAKYALVLVLVEYRMAPEYPGRGAVDDCHAGLLWTVEHAAELSIDPTRVILAGESGGGGLAAGTALLNRDLGGPELLAQALWCPQVDDRSDYPSAEQFTAKAGAGGFWSRENHEFAWKLILGDGHETREDVSPYTVPSRATDLSDLPPAFIDVGGAELFRDPAVQYASGLWAAGVNAELHVWPGAFHGSDVLFPAAGISAPAIAAREGWLRRTLK